MIGELMRRVGNSESKMTTASKGNSVNSETNSQMKNCKRGVQQGQILQHDVQSMRDHDLRKGDLLHQVVLCLGNKNPPAICAARECPSQLSPNLSLCTATLRSPRAVLGLRLAHRRRS